MPQRVPHPNATPPPSSSLRARGPSSSVPSLLVTPYLLPLAVTTPLFDCGEASPRYTRLHTARQSSGSLPKVTNHPILTMRRTGLSITLAVLAVSSAAQAQQYGQNALAQDTLQSATEYLEHFGRILAGVGDGPAVSAANYAVPTVASGTPYSVPTVTSGMPYSVPTVSSPTVAYPVAAPILTQCPVACTPATKALLGEELRRLLQLNEVRFTEGEGGREVGKREE